jgi:hypothetical protein
MPINFNAPQGSVFGRKTKAKTITKTKNQFTTSLTGATLGIKETNKQATGFTGLELRGI